MEQNTLSKHSTLVEKLRTLIRGRDWRKDTSWKSEKVSLGNDAQGNDVQITGKELSMMVTMNDMALAGAVRMQGMRVMPMTHYSLYVADVPGGLPLRFVDNFVMRYLEEHMPMVIDTVHIHYAVVQVPFFAGDSEMMSVKGEVRRTKRRQAYIVVCPKRQLAADYADNTRFVISEFVLCNAFLQHGKTLQGTYIAVAHMRMHAFRYTNGALIEHCSVPLSHHAQSSACVNTKRFVDEMVRFMQLHAHEAEHVLCERKYRNALEAAVETVRMRDVEVHAHAADMRVPKSAVFVVSRHKLPACVRYAVAIVLGLLCGFGAFSVYSMSARRAYTRVRHELARESTQLMEVQERLVDMRTAQSAKRMQDLYALIARVSAVGDARFVMQSIVLQKTGVRQYAVRITARARDALAVVAALKTAQLFRTLALEQVMKRDAVEYFTLKGVL